MGYNASLVFKANRATSFTESFLIQTLEISLSLKVTSAPLWLLHLLLYQFPSLQIIPLSPLLQSILLYPHDWKYILFRKIVSTFFVFLPLSAKILVLSYFLRLSSHIQRVEFANIIQITNKIYLLDYMLKNH